MQRHIHLEIQFQCDDSWWSHISEMKELFNVHGFFEALECYHEGKYIGFRKEAKSLRRCIETLLKTCTPAPELFGADLPGCFVSNHLEWEFCSIPECGKCC